MHLRLKNIVIVHFTMRRENQTMVDKIPWDTCVIALIDVVNSSYFIITRFLISSLISTRSLIKPWPNGPASSRKWTQVELA